MSDLSVVSLHVMLPQELADDLPPIDRSFGNFRGRGLDVAGGDVSSQDLPAEAITNRTATFDRFLAGLGRDERRPTLHFLHSGLPHQPWEYLPDGTHYRLLRSRPPGERLTADPAPARQVLQQYMLQTVYVDRLLGRLMRRMRSLGLDRRAALVVTADHGVSFRPDDETRSANATNIGGVGGVPLFIKAPGQRRGRVDESAARTVDILPTLAAELGLEPRWRTDGRPLADRGGPARANVAVKTLFDKTTSVSFAQFLQARDAVASSVRDTSSRASTASSSCRGTARSRDGRSPRSGARPRAARPSRSTEPISSRTSTRTRASCRWASPAGSTEPAARRCGWRSLSTGASPRPRMRTRTAASWSSARSSPHPRWSAARTTPGCLSSTAAPAPRR